LTCAWTIIDLKTQHKYLRLVGRSVGTCTSVLSKIYLSMLEYIIYAHIMCIKVYKKKNLKYIFMLYLIYNESRRNILTSGCVLIQAVLGLRRGKL